MISSTLIKNLIIVFAASVLINGFILLACYLSVAPSGTDLLLSVIPFAMAPMGGAVMFASLLFLTVLFSPNNRLAALKLILGCVIYLIVSLPSIGLAEDIRHNGFVQLVQRSRPLITAIRQFETKYGKPPENIQQLIPEFLSEVPQTRTGVFRYEYEILTDERILEGNQWLLRVEAPSGAKPVSFLVYLPNQNYSRLYSRSRVEEIEDWAYIH